MAAMLIIFSGLPGIGKTTIARELARQIGAVHLRIDSIEQAIRESGVVVRSLDDSGYRVAYALAEDNLNLGRTVIGDSVNPSPVTRDAWRAVAERARVAVLEVEVTCSDAQEHRTRVETRTTDVPGLNLPTWQDVVDRDYRPWDRERLVLGRDGRPVEAVTGSSSVRLRLSLRQVFRSRHLTSRRFSATAVERLWESCGVYAVVMHESECSSGLHCNRARAVWRRRLVFGRGVPVVSGSVTKPLRTACRF